MIGTSSKPNKTLSVFDFDGTLTKRDSFIPFLKFAFGRKIFLKRMSKLFSSTSNYLLNRLTRDELKAKLINLFLTNIEEQWLSEQAELFCQLRWLDLMRPNALLAVKAELDSGAEVTICSASPVLVLKPFAKRLGIKLIGTELAVADHHLTGQIIGKNCRGAEKIARLEQIYGSLSQYHLRAWGDSRGDYELLLAADDAYWQPFHPSWKRRPCPFLNIQLKQL